METQPKRAKSSIKRLMRDLRYLNDNPIENLYIHYEESNLGNDTYKENIVFIKTKTQENDIAMIDLFAF